MLSIMFIHEAIRYKILIVDASTVADAVRNLRGIHKAVNRLGWFESR